MNSARLINNMHNSNHKTRQATLSGEIIEENKFYVLGFVPAKIVALKKEVLFMKLTNEQIDSVVEFLNARATFFFSLGFSLPW